MDRPVLRSDLYKDEIYYLQYNSMWDEQIFDHFQSEEIFRLNKIERANYTNWIKRGWIKKGTEKACSRCNKMFIQSRSDALYCSPECRKQQFLDRRKLRRRKSGS